MTTSGSLDITPTEETQLNRVSEATMRAGLGNVLDDMQDRIEVIESGCATALAQIVNLSGSATTAASHYIYANTHNVAGADISGSIIYILTGTSVMNSFIVQYYRSGSIMQNINVISSGSRLTVTPATAGSLVFTSGDSVEWMVS